MKNIKEYLLKSGTPSLTECLRVNWFPSISYDYRLIYTYMLMHEEIKDEMEFLVDSYEEELDFERGVGND